MEEEPHLCEMCEYPALIYEHDKFFSDDDCLEEYERRTGL